MEEKGLEMALGVVALLGIVVAIWSLKSPARPSS
jgi:hypothetical protein